MLNSVDKQFHALYQNLIANGHLKGDRTGHGTLMLPAQMMRLDCTEGKLPILSSRFIPTKAFRREQLWFISGNSSIKYLRDHKVGVWDSWFIPGTDKYDEPVVKDLSMEERLKTQEAINSWQEIDFVLKTIQHAAKGIGSAHLELTTPDGTVIEYNNLSRDSYTEFSKWLDSIGVPTTVTTAGGEKISLQRRLARVSKNNTEAWETINKVIDEDWEKLRINWVGDSLLDNKELQTFVIFREGKFQEVELLPIVAACVSATLDELKVPAYELLDADIGAGGYGPNWRTWQDTQVIDGGDSALMEAYHKQGYECLGTLQEGTGWDNGRVVMHREIDQLQNAINMLKVNPDDRRMLVTAWNPGRTWQAALPPCHLYFQFVSWVKTTKELETVIRKSNLHGQYLQAAINDAHADQPDQENAAWFHQAAYNFCVKNGLMTRNITLFVLLRSSDAPLGLCFNTAQYAYLLHMVGHVVNMDPNELVSVGVDTHIYQSQIPMVKELLTRDSMQESDPRVVFKRKVDNIDDFTFDDIDIVGYVGGPKMDIPVAV